MVETTTRIYELQVKLAQESLASLKKVEASAKTIEQNFASATGVIKEFGKGLLAAFTVGAVVSFVEKSIDAAAALDDLAEKTGASVEKLSQLQQVAHISGTDISIVEGFIVKLNKALHGSDDEAKGAGSAVAALGLNIDDLKKMDPADAMLAVARAFDKFADSGAKSAAMTALTGKAAKDAAPFLKDLVTEGERAVSMTAEQAAKAEELQKQWRRLTLDATLAAQAMTRDLIPALSRITLAMHEAYKQSGLLMAAWVGLGGVAANLLGLDPTQKLADDLEKVSGQLAVAKKQLAAGSLKPEGSDAGLFGFLVPDVKLGETQLAKVRSTVTALEKEKARLEAVLNPPKPVEPPKPALLFDPGAAEKARKLAEQLRREEEERKRRAAEAAKEEARKKKEREAGIKSMVESLDLEEERARKEGLAANAGKTGTQVLQERRKVIDELTGAGATKKLIDQLALINELFENGEITITEATTALEKFATVQKPVADTSAEMNKLIESLADKVDGYAKSISDSLIDFATGAKDAKVSFSDFVSSVLRDLAKMATQMLLIEPVMASFKSWLKTVDLSSIGLSAPKLNAKGGVYSSPSLAAYSGGVYDSPKLFKFAKGAGVFAEAGPEAIMPLKRGSDGALGVDATGAGVTINVINEARAEVQTKARTDVNGNRIIELLVKDAVSNGIRSGAFDGVMGATYGVNRQGAR